MRFWDNIKAFFRGRRMQRYQRETSSGYRTGVTVTSGLAAGGGLSISTVYRCVRFIADSVANLPMQYMRLTNAGVYVEDTADPLHYLLTVQPDSNMSAFDFWTQLVEQVLLTGNAYVVPVFGMDGRVARLVLCSRGSVSHDVYNDTYTVNDTYNRLAGKYDEADIIHIKGQTGPDGKNGLSVLHYARLCLGIATAADEETLSRFRSGGAVRGIMGNEKGVFGLGEYQDEQLEKLAVNVDERFRSGERIVSLPGQVAFTQLSLSSTDMQFLETRKFTVREICRFFGVHPSFVFDDTSNNYKSAEMANVAYLSNTLNPLLKKIENEFMRKLVPASLCHKRRFVFDRMGLYACDLDSRVKYQTQTIGAGLFTVNEWRRMENKLPIEGGDALLVSANLKSIKELAEGKSAPVEDTKTDIQDNQDNDNGKDDNGDTGEPDGTATE